MFYLRTCAIVVSFVAIVAFAAAPEKAKPPRERPDSEIGGLLNDLEAQNKGSDRFDDPWLETMKLIVDLGPEATPELIKELDHTSDGLMLRCMGFVMRSMDDKRAVPALIRAIPKTLVAPGSDMGLRVQDKELEPFAHKHDLNDRDEPGRYDVGRPVREIFGALHKLTGENLEDEQVFSIFVSGNEHQVAMKRDIFHRQATKWAKWWEANAAKFDVEEEYRVVKLPPHEKAKVVEPSVDTPYKTEYGSSNCMLNPLQTADARKVFFDFDTGRASKLPKKWRLKENLKPGEYPVPQKEILKWAAEEGYDMMGEELPLKDGKTVFAIRLIDITARQLPMSHWQENYSNVLLKDVIGSGQPLSLIHI